MFAGSGQMGLKPSAGVLPDVFLLIKAPTRLPLSKKFERNGSGTPTFKRRRFSAQTACRTLPSQVINMTLHFDPPIPRTAYTGVTGGSLPHESGWCCRESDSDTCARACGLIYPSRIYNGRCESFTVGKMSRNKAGPVNIDA